MKNISFLEVKDTLPLVDENIQKSSVHLHKLDNEIDSAPADIAVAQLGSMLTKEEPTDVKNDIALVDESRKAGIKYIVFPKRKKSKKSHRCITHEVLQTVCKKLNESPQILTRYLLLTFAKYIYKI